MSRTNALTLSAYVVLIAALAGGLLTARARVLGSPDAAASRADWLQWRREAERQSGDQGPVKRRMPDATEAPTVLLLRDHFAACLTLALLISTVLFATLVFMIRGVLLGPKVQPYEDAGRGPGS